MDRGFSTLEIMIALAIMMVVLTGSILSGFSAGYWAITSQTSNEALYKAKDNLEQLRANAKQDFNSVVSKPAADEQDASCQGGGLCYSIENVVTDVSSCSKYAEAKVSWQVKRYPASTTSLFTYLTNPTEAIAEGGDCPLEYPTGPWTSPTTQAQWGLNVGSPTGEDFLDGNIYVTGDAAPYLAVVTPAGPVGFSNSFIGAGPFQGLDVARDAATGRTYAYVASAGEQLQVIDITDTGNPVLVSSRAMKGVSNQPDGSGQLAAYYGRQVFVATLTGGGPEFHALDAVNPAAPVESGSGVTIGASVNAIVVRDQHSSGAHCQAHGGVCRFAYLATSSDDQEVAVLDVTDIANITTAATFNLPDSDGCSSNQPDARSLALLGNVLYVGRNASGVCSELPELYALDVTDPYAGVTLKNGAEIGSSVTSIRASGPYLIMGAGSGGSETLHVRRSAPADLSAIAAFTLPGLADNGLDYDNTYLYALNRTQQALQIIYNP